MAEKNPGFDRRSLLRTTGALAGAAAVGGLATAEECGHVERSAYDGDLESEQAEFIEYETRTEDPCSVALSLSLEFAPEGSTPEFDLLVTHDGRRPSRREYDARTRATGVDESLTVDGDDLETGATLGILVLSQSGAGNYVLSVTERGGPRPTPEDGRLRLREVHPERDDGWGATSKLSSIVPDRYTGFNRRRPEPEHVVVENVGDRAVDLGEYRLGDAADHEFEFPDERLPPGWLAVVETASGVDSRDTEAGVLELHWPTTPVWNDTGDTATLRRDDQVVDVLHYGREDGGLGIRHVRPEGEAEAVVLENTGDHHRDLAGYTVADEAGHEHELGDWTIPPGWTLTLRTRGGNARRDPDGDNLIAFAGYGRSIWNDDGDVATLRAPDGRRVDSLAYGTKAPKDTGVAIAGVDPQGEAESITVESTGEDPLALAGYRIEDDDGHAFEFDAGILDAGETLELFTRSRRAIDVDSGADEVAFWGREQSVWNDGGDVALVRDPDGQYADRFEYEPSGELEIAAVDPLDREESVLLENVGEGPVDVGGYVVGDDDGNRVELVESELGPGERLELFTFPEDAIDAESDADLVHFWGRRRSVWNDGGDVVVLEDPQGRVLQRGEYDAWSRLEVLGVLSGGDDESVLLGNTGAGSLDVGEYSVADEAGHAVDLASVELSAGEVLELFTRSEAAIDDTSSAADHVQFWGRSRSVWNDGGDEAIVRDSEGRYVDRFDYDGEADLVIDAVHPEGDAESVVLENDGEATADLAGYRVSDEADHDVEFGSLFVAPGETVELFTRAEEDLRNPQSDADHRLFWGQGRSVWNDGGDTATLRTPDGQFADRVEY
jgi:hypothetical protein